MTSPANKLLNQIEELLEKFVPSPDKEKLLELIEDFGDEKSDEGYEMAQDDRGLEL